MAVAEPVYLCSYLAEDEPTTEECECECPCNANQFNKTSTWDSCCHMLGDDSSIEEKYDYVMSMAPDKLETSYREFPQSLGNVVSVHAN